MTTTFTITEVYPQIYQIAEPFYKEHAFMYCIKGQQNSLLIDAGIGICNPLPFLNAQNLFPKVIPTHIHYDHAGGLVHFKKEDLLLPPSCEQNLHKHHLWGTEFLSPKDFTANPTAQSLDTLCAHFSPKIKEYTLYTSAHIQVDPFVFCIIPMPGHTDDHIVLYEPYHRLLFSGDMLYDGQIYCSCKNSNLQQFRTSLQLLKQLDILFTFPGHNQILNTAQTKKVLHHWENELEKQLQS